MGGEAVKRFPRSRIMGGGSPKPIIVGAEVQWGDRMSIFDFVGDFAESLGVRESGTRGTWRRPQASPAFPGQETPSPLVTG